MKLRRAICVLAFALLAAPLAAEAQQAGKVPRIALLSSQSPEAVPDTFAFRDGLRELGYVEGKNITIEWRWARGDARQFANFAAEMVRLKVDIIIASTNPAILAAWSATKTIPIVMVFASDPVGLGFVGSVARPGGNVTGLTWQTRELVAKRLQLLKEAVPNLSRVAVLWDPSEPGRRDQVEEAEVAAAALGVQLQVLEVRSPGGLEDAFAAMAQARAGAVLVEASAMLGAHGTRIGELGVKGRLPTIGWFGRMVEDGCLMSYSPRLSSQYRRAAYFVDRILKGAKPADLPIEQHTKYELVINLKTAKALGLTIPRSLLIRADQVIE